MNTERREARRFSLNLTVGKTSSQEASGKVVDFSRRGMRVIMDTPVFDNNTDVRIFINQPDYNHRIPIDVSVIWVKDLGGKYEVGLRFKDIPAQTKADFLDYGYKAWLRKKSTDK